MTYPLALIALVVALANGASKQSSTIMLIDIAADRHRVPRRLLRAVAWVESRYDANAVSDHGAIGLFQLKPATAVALGVDPLEPSAAADGAARLLAGYYRRWSSWPHALAAYAWGPGNVTREPSPSSWPAPVRHYIERVLERAGLPNAS